MPTFIYNAIEKNGKAFSGQVKAEDIKKARLQLKLKRVDVISIEEKTIVPFSFGSKKVKKTVIFFFTRQLSFLLDAGVSLIQALEMCIETSSSIVFKDVLNGIIKQLEAGRSLSKCLKMRPDVFDDFYVNMVVCAEETGLLDQVLKDLADYMEKAEQIKSRVKSAMMYPVVVLAISLLIITGLIVFIVPRFANMYGDKGLPTLTQALVSLSDLMRNNPLPLIAAFLGIPLFMYKYSQTSTGRQQVRSLIRALPLFGKIQYQAAMVRFFRSFHSLLKAGVNFLEALDVSYNITDHANIQKGIKAAKEYVTEGKGFSKGLAASQAFPPLVSQMVRIGEESGKMEKSFEKLTVYYEDILNNLISGLIKMIEPLLMVFLGGIIG
ncbi:MAG: type II secretion system F family protein, partial [Oligoflexia bacterium]|nr:type II secretion system F family protein [Oligoflexia bacterium]